jgi:hypothetical protein
VAGCAQQSHLCFCVFVFVLFSDFSQVVSGILLGFGQVDIVRIVFLARARPCVCLCRSSDFGRLTCVRVERERERELNWSIWLVRRESNRLRKCLNSCVGYELPKMKEGL